MSERQEPNWLLNRDVVVLRYTANMVKALAYERDTGIVELALKQGCCWYTEKSWR